MEVGSNDFALIALKQSKILILIAFIVVMGIAIIPGTAFAHTKAYWVGYNNGRNDAKGGVYDSVGSCNDQPVSPATYHMEHVCINGYSAGFHDYCGKKDSAVVTRMVKVLIGQKTFWAPIRIIFLFVLAFTITTGAIIGIQNENLQCVLCSHNLS